MHNCACGKDLYLSLGNYQSQAGKRVRIFKKMQDTTGRRGDLVVRTVKPEEKVASLSVMAVRVVRRRKTSGIPILAVFLLSMLMGCRGGLHFCMSGVVDGTFEALCHQGKPAN